MTREISPLHSGGDAFEDDDHEWREFDAASEVITDADYHVLLTMLPATVDRKLYDWRDKPPQIDSVSHKPYSEQKKWFNDSQLLDLACNLALRSETMQGVVKLSQDAEKLSIGLYETPGCGFYCCQLQLIELSDALDFWAWSWVLSHEVRHGYHDEHDILEIQNSLELRDRIFLNRLFEADSHAVHMTVAWELKMKGYPKPWIFIKNDEHHARIADAFEVMALSDPESVHDGRASHEAFKAFFKTPMRLEAYERSVFCRYEIKDLEAEFRKSASYEPDPCKVTQRLHGVLETLKHMPYINAQGGLCERPYYLPEDFITELLTDKIYRKISTPDHELKVTMLENGYSHVENDLGL